MHWISIILIGFASNIDNLGIGVSFGARSTRITRMSNVIIAVLSMVATYISITAGQMISGYLSGTYANLLGGCLIMGMGIWSVKASLTAPVVSPPEPAPVEGAGPQQVLRNPLAADTDYNHIISWKESIPLGTALALNCIATGFGAGVSGVMPLMTALSVGIFSLATVAAGQRIGNQLARTWLGKYSSLLGGILLFGIGLYEVIV